MRFLGTTPARRVRSARVDDVTLQKGGDPQDVTAKQYERLKALKGYRFEEVKSGKGDK